MKPHLHPVIFLVDMQSFYCSVEKADHNEYKHKPLIVAGDPAKRSGIVLAACPIAKSFGVQTTEWIKQALAKCPELIVVQPRMQLYIDVSIQITTIFERYTDLVEPFSIDEQFLDVTESQNLFGGPHQIASDIQRAILAETKVNARVGIGPNKILAKMACDNFAKKNKDGIFLLNEENMKEKLWQLPIPNMFGVGGRMTRHMQRMGIHYIGDLAKLELGSFKQMMRARMGKQADIHAELLWLTANGIDYSPVTPTTHNTQKAIGHNMTTPRDYTRADEIETLLLELSEEVGRRARAKGYMGDVVSCGCRGADFDQPTGFYRQMKLPLVTNHGPDISSAARALFHQHWDGQPVRSVGVTLTGLTPDGEYQVDLFRDRESEIRLDRAMDAIKSRYGPAAIMRATSITPAGLAKDRAAKIGGHYK
jgi:DNA polymerase-4